MNMNFNNKKKYNIVIEDKTGREGAVRSRTVEVNMPETDNDLEVLQMLACALGNTLNSLPKTQDNIARLIHTLHVAASIGQEEAVSNILESKLISPNHISGMLIGMTVNKNAKGVQSLLKSGFVDPNFMHQGKTPLMIAAAKGYSTIVNMLAQTEGCDLEMKTPSNQDTALGLAVRCKQLEAVKALIESGASPEAPITLTATAQQNGQLVVRNFIMPIFKAAQVLKCPQDIIITLQKGVKPKQEVKEGQLLLMREREAQAQPFPQEGPQIEGKPQQPQVEGQKRPGKSG